MFERKIKLVIYLAALSRATSSSREKLCVIYHLKCSLGKSISVKHLLLEKVQFLSMTLIAGLSKVSGYKTEPENCSNILIYRSPLRQLCAYLSSCANLSLGL